MNKAIFLDRDGTINVEKDYMYRPEDFEFIDGVPEAIKTMNELGYKVIVITNQSGIARGYYTENDLQVLHQYIDQKLKEVGANIDAYYYCPHHPTEGVGKYKVDCNCRKPKTGLYEQAILDYDIDTQKSWVVGDRIRDLIPADILGMNKALVLTGYGENEIKRAYEKGIKVCNDLWECIRYIQFGKVNQ